MQLQEKQVCMCVCMWGTVQACYRWGYCTPWHCCCAILGWKRSGGPRLAAAGKTSVYDCVCANGERMNKLGLAQQQCQGWQYARAKRKRRAKFAAAQSGAHLCEKVSMFEEVYVWIWMSYTHSNHIPARRSTSLHTSLSSCCKTTHCAFAKGG